MDYDEIAYAVHDALICYNKCRVNDIFSRAEWLWRAAAYLKAGLKAKIYSKQFNPADKEKFDKALNVITKEILPALKSMYSDTLLAKATIASAKSPQASLKVLMYITRLNELRDDLVEISTYTDFLVIEPLVLNEKTVRKTTSVLRKLNKVPEIDV